MSRSMSIGTTTPGPRCTSPYFPSDVHGWPASLTAWPRSYASRVASASTTRWPSASAIDVSASSAWISGPSTSARTSAAVLEAVVDERVADLAEDLQERRRREPHAARELHVVPGERHVQCRRDEQADPLLLGEVRCAAAELPGDEAVGVEGHVAAVLLGRADRDEDGVDAPFAQRLDLGPGQPLEEALLVHRAAPSSQSTLAYPERNARAAPLTGS
jgi:hypothetical protein